MSKWSTALNVIAKIAPSIASAAGGPLAGSAVSILETALGVYPESPDLTKRQDAIAGAMVNATPETLAAIKKADADFQTRMTELGFADSEAIAKLANDDRANARQRESTTRDWTPRVLSISVTMGFFTILGYIAMASVPDSSKDILNVMLGSLGAAWVAIVTYYFGSSSDSAHKTEILATNQAK